MRVAREGSEKGAKRAQASLCRRMVEAGENLRSLVGLGDGKLPISGSSESSESSESSKLLRVKESSNKHVIRRGRGRGAAAVAYSPFTTHYFTHGEPILRDSAAKVTRLACQHSLTIHRAPAWRSQQAGPIQASPDLRNPYLDRSDADNHSLGRQHSRDLMHPSAPCTTSTDKGLDLTCSVVQLTQITLV